MNNTQKNRKIGKILLADDEDTFLKSAVELLRRENYLCECVSNGREGIEKISVSDDFDVLIADIKMPGNSELEMAKKAAQIRPGIKIILITGYPSQQSAIEAVNIPVAAYMLKPIDFNELLNNVAEAMKSRMLYKTVLRTKRNLGLWIQELENIEQSFSDNQPQMFQKALNSYLDITTAKINVIFAEIGEVADLFDTFKTNGPVCNLLNCPNLNELTGVIEDAIESLKTTKDSYRSKQLGQLRENLEKLLKNIR